MIYLLNNILNFVDRKIKNEIEDGRSIKFRKIVEMNNRFNWKYYYV